MGYPHLLEDSNGELLKSVNLNRTLLGLAHVAVSCAKLTDGAELATGEAQRVVRQDNLGGTVPVFVLNVVDETLDIYRGRAALLARSVVTLEAALGLSNGLLNGHQRDITLPVVDLCGTVAVRSPVEFLRVSLSDLGIPESWLGDLVGYRSHNVLLDVIRELREALLGAAATTSAGAARAKLGHAQVRQKLA